MIEGALRRDRVLVVAAMLAVTALSWAYLLAGAGMSMHEMDGMLMPMRVGPWTPGYAALLLVMWATMMAAMMLPGAAPMILFYGSIARRRRERGDLAAATGAFAFGYLAIWAAFSLAAVILQFGLERAALLSPMMQTTSVAFAGAVLIAAGVYQWTPLKQACLRHCRSPLDFVMTEWREGKRGALVMGLRHGSYCVGCCWVLMLLLLVGGVMNFAWIGGLALFVLVEKVAPAGHWLGRVAGLGLIAWGGTVLAGLSW
ncbi:Predicted metal-binding membrane protein [Rhizobiales bacterium GAS191]|jgi:predicted metal-binding membrane protein|nr:Predicted metal-binding membrane protein [Rhizobiales bacterium GAS113]SEC91783.1 Predicted metal-binding membrane protein [Rhizobiales bacterium GAS191]